MRRNQHAHTPGINKRRSSLSCLLWRSAIFILLTFAVCSSAWSENCPISPGDFLARQQFVETNFGRIAYVEQGQGPAALYIHGALLNGFQWRYQLADLADIRRGIAIDTMGMGYTEPRPGLSLDIGNQASMVAAFLDALNIDVVDVVGNDSGGGIAQIFAARYPQRVRSLTITNAEVVGFEANNPTLDQFRRSVESGELTASVKDALQNPAAAQVSLATAFEFPARVAPATIQHYFGPLVQSSNREKMMQDYLLAISDEELRATESQLKALRAPSMILWGNADVFFPTELAYWLRDNLANVRLFEELEGGMLFFPEEHPEWLNERLRSLWQSVK